MFDLGEIVRRVSDWLTKEQAADPDAKLKAAGEAAVAEAARLWQSDVYDPPRSDNSERAKQSKAAISDMLRVCGWTWEVPYQGDGQVEWCGIFAATCWRKAGLRLDVAKTWFPSTYRLVNYARYKPFDEKNRNPRPAAGPYRLIADLNEDSTAASLPFAPRAGDILIIGPTGADKHICVIDRLEGNVFQTIEGNGNGLGPDHKQRQGVVRGLRALGREGMRQLQTTWHARQVIRPALGDLG